MSRHVRHRGKSSSESEFETQTIKQDAVASRHNQNQESLRARRDHGDGGIDERGKDRWRLRLGSMGSATPRPCAALLPRPSGNSDVC
jgi:hypothetical protein